MIQIQFLQWGRVVGGIIAFLLFMVIGAMVFDPATSIMVLLGLFFLAVLGVALKPNVILERGEFESFQAVEEYAQRKMIISLKIDEERLGEKIVNITGSQSITFLGKPGSILLGKPVEVILVDAAGLSVVHTMVFRENQIILRGPLDILIG